MPDRSRCQARCGAGTAEERSPDVCLRDASGESGVGDEREPLPAPGPSGAASTSSCTRIRRTRSSTARRCRRSSPPARPSSATTRSRSPTTTASTARSSSRTPRSTSASARSPAPRSRSPAARTSRCSARRRRGYANLCRILTDAHAGTRLAGPESASCCRPRRRIDVVAAHAEGLVCLSGCARHGLGVVDPNARRAARAGVPGAFYVELQRPYERGDARRNAALDELAAALGVPDGRDRRRARPPSAPRAAAGRARRDPQPHLARRLRARAARQPRVACSSRRRRCSSGCRATRPHRTREVADRCTFDLTQELGYRYPDFSDGPDPADVAAAAHLRARVRRALRATRTATSGARTSGSTTSCALIARLGLAGLLPAPLGGARARARVRARGARPRQSRATRCRPAAGAARASARSSAT